MSRAFSELNQRSNQERQCPLLEALIRQDTQESPDGKKVNKEGMAALMSLAEQKLSPEEVGRLKEEIEEDLRRLAGQGEKNDAKI